MSGRSSQLTPKGNTMIAVHRRPLRLVAAVLALGLLGAACGSPSGSAKGKVEESTTTTTIARGPDTTAAQLRSKLSGLFGEHVYLASAATGAAAGARADEFRRRRRPGRQLGRPHRQHRGHLRRRRRQGFDPLWKKHVGFFVAYTQGLAAGTEARRPRPSAT